MRDMPPASNALEGANSANQPIASAGNAWIISFADLMALLLAFFVMMFSMSSIQTHAWLAVVTGLSDKLAPGREQSILGEVKNSRPQRVLEPKGIDLGYLEAVIREKFSRHPVLKHARFVSRQDRFSILLPAGLLFENDSATPSRTAELTLRTAGDALSSVKNRIEIHAYAVVAPGEQAGELSTDDNPFATGWALALTRAAIAANLVQKAGLQRAPVPVGHGVSGTDDAKEMIALVIREMGGGGK